MLQGQRPESTLSSPMPPDDQVHSSYENGLLGLTLLSNIPLSDIFLLSFAIMESGAKTASSRVCFGNCKCR